MSDAQESPSVDVWIGTAGNGMGQKEGIYRASLSQDARRLSQPKLFLELKGAGWVSHSTTKRMYATGVVAGKPSVVTFDPGDNNIPLQSQPIDDGGSCFVTTDRTGRILISAQYGGGSVAVFPINPDGTIAPRSQLFDHEGGSKRVGRRQDSPHPHYVEISPDNRFAFVPDLGLDQLVVYKIDADAGKLIAHGKIDVEKAGGPRHMKIHPSGKYAFVLNELSLSVTVFSYDAPTGTMKKLKTVPTLSEDEKKQNEFNSASEIRIHPLGKCVVTANRGDDTLSVFKFDEVTGELVRIQVEPVRGSWPRNFNFSPDGSMLLAAGRDSNSLAVFEVQAEGCRLKYIQHNSSFVPAPICVAFPVRVE